MRKTYQCNSCSYCICPNRGQASVSIVSTLITFIPSFVFNRKSSCFCTDPLVFVHTHGEWLTHQYSVIFVMKEDLTCRRQTEPWQFVFFFSAHLTAFNFNHCGKLTPLASLLTSNSFQQWGARINLHSCHSAQTIPLFENQPLFGTRPILNIPPLPQPQF